MRIYLGHSKKMDYKNELYEPLKNDEYFKKHELILPHEYSNLSSNTRDFYKTIDIFIADVSYPGTGLGIELGWAYDDNVDIYCIYKKGSKVSNSIKVVTDKIYEYDTTIDMVNIVKDIVENRKEN